MNTQLILEMIGYLGSALVIVSMLMTSVVKLRIINTIGGVIFCGYALCIHSYPTAAMQVCLIVINLINLYKLNNTKKEYTAISVKAEDGFLAHFLFTYINDIKKYFPDFLPPQNDAKIFLITCGEVPAGVFAAKEEADGNLHVELDYTTPAYRDCSAGKFLYNHLKHLGIKSLSAETKIPSHEKYLKKMGFKSKSINKAKEEVSAFNMSYIKQL